MKYSAPKVSRPLYNRVINELYKHLISSPRKVLCILSEIHLIYSSLNILIILKPEELSVFSAKARVTGKVFWPWPIQKLENDSNWSNVNMTNIV